MSILKKIVRSSVKKANKILANAMFSMDFFLLKFFI